MKHKHPYKAVLHRINDSKQLLLNSEFRKNDAFSVYLTFFYQKYQKSKIFRKL